MLPLVLNFTPTGMLPMKKDCPFVPTSPKEIIEDVRIANEQGITSVHLHARDEATGEPTYHKEVFAEIITGIRAFAPELVVVVTTSGRKYSQVEKRAEVLELEGFAKPDMASLTLSSLNFNNVASVNEPSTIQALCRIMLERGIKPELEAFDVGMLNYAKYLISKDLLEPPFCFSLIFGNIACAQADFLTMGLMLNNLPTNSFPQFGGIGRYQQLVNAVAVASGYGVRVGLEDNYWFDEQRTILASNEMLLSRVRLLAKTSGREIMKPAEIRKHLHLKPGNGEYGCL